MLGKKLGQVEKDVWEPWANFRVQARLDIMGIWGSVVLIYLEGTVLD